MTDLEGFLGIEPREKEYQIAVCAIRPMHLHFVTHTTPYLVSRHLTF